jgi:hypothetical protein
MKLCALSTYQVSVCLSVCLHVCFLGVGSLFACHRGASGSCALRCCLQDTVTALWLARPASDAPVLGLAAVPPTASPLPPLALGRLVSHCRFAMRCHDVDAALQLASLSLGRPPTSPALTLAPSAVQPHPVVRCTTVTVQAGGPTSVALPTFTVVVRGDVVLVCTEERSLPVAGVPATAR